MVYFYQLKFHFVQNYYYYLLSFETNIKHLRIFLSQFIKIILHQNKFLQEANSLLSTIMFFIKLAEIILWSFFSFISYHNVIYNYHSLDWTSIQSSSLSSIRIAIHGSMDALKQTIVTTRYKVAFHKSSPLRSSLDSFSSIDWTAILRIVITLFHGRSAIYDIYLSYVYTLRLCAFNIPENCFEN